MYTETLSTELKEFFIPTKLLTRYDRANIRECIISGKYYGNERIKESIKFSLNKYFLKYLSGWNHADIKLETGHLYFGIDDDGAICGIPYRGHINNQFIMNHLRYLLKKTSLTPKQQNNFMKKVDLDIISVKPSKVDTMKNYYYQLDQEKKHVENVADYSEKYSIWCDKLKKYSVKLIKYLNHPVLRKELINFIRDNNNTNAQEIIDCINTHNEWEKLPLGDINSLKKNSRNFYFWVTTFKDVMVIKIKKERPVYNAVRTINYETFYRSAKLMGHLFSSDESINFYVIKISIPNTKKQISIETSKGIQIFKRYHTIQGPCSSPL